MPRHSRSSAFTRHGAVRVAPVAVSFWVLKALSTALGESTSDYLVHAINPFVAVGFGFVGFVLALSLQLSRRRYVPWAYWLAVAAVGVFGTMAADAVHVGAHVPYPVSTLLYGALLVAVFVVWGRTEKTLSIHTIDSTRRELFYWLAVGATFAMGTALGDLTAYSFHLGYLGSALFFAGMIAVPAIGYRVFRWHPVLTFWLAYVMTRPLGASSADYLGKPPSVSGLGWGAGPVATGLALAMAFGVAALSVAALSVLRPTERRSETLRLVARTGPAEETRRDTTSG